jgi:hypothetical protein
MAEPIQCPGCRAPIRVPAEFHLAWLTCARCRALVPNPVAQTVRPEPERPAVATESARPTSPPAANVLTCRHCGKPSRNEWLFCPHCEEPLRSPLSGGSDRWSPRKLSPDSERMVPIALLGAFGLIFLLLSTASAFANGNAVPLLIFVVCAGVILAASALVTIVREEGKLSLRSFGRLLLNVLILIGTLVAVCFVVALAAILFGLFALAIRGC